jgi:hypothetical protein
MARQNRESARMLSEVVEGSRELVESCQRMSELLAFGIAIQSDALFHAAFRDAAPEVPCALDLGHGGPFVVLWHDGVEPPGSIAGEAPPHSPTFSVAELMERTPSLATTARARLRASGAQAEATRLVHLMQNAGHQLSARDFGAVARWAPLIAVPAYRHVALIQMLLDRASPSLLKEATESTLAWRWTLIHALSH